MRLFRFVVGPEQLKIAYEPFDGFRDGVMVAAARFSEKHGVYPNACYVSVRFGDLPNPLYLGEGELMRFRRQTLLADGEVLLGVEVETDLWEEDDERFNERAVG